MGVGICIKEINFTDLNRPIAIDFGSQCKFVKDGDPFVIISDKHDLGVIPDRRFATDVVISYQVCPSKNSCSSKEYSMRGHVIAKVMRPN